MGKINYVIGDIHGCMNELLLLEEKACKHAKGLGHDAKFIGVGDLIDRGPASQEVVEHFRKGVKAGTHETVLGNHEMMMLEVLYEWSPELFKGITRPPWFIPTSTQYKWRTGFTSALGYADFRVLKKCFWLGNGGHETLKSYGCDSQKPESWFVTKDHLAFWFQRPLVWQNPKAIVTHALALKQDLKFVSSAERPRKLTEMQTMHQKVESLIWNRDLDMFSKLKKKHISGHTTFKKVNFNSDKMALQIDTSCVFGGRLAAHCVESDELLTVNSDFSWQRAPI